MAACGDRLDEQQQKAASRPVSQSASQPSAMASLSAVPLRPSALLSAPTCLSPLFAPIGSCACPRLALCMAWPSAAVGSGRRATISSALCDHPCRWSVSCCSSSLVCEDCADASSRVVCVHSDGGGANKEREATRVCSAAGARTAPARSHIGDDADAWGGPSTTLRCTAASPLDTRVQTESTLIHMHVSLLSV